MPARDCRPTLERGTWVVDRGDSWALPTSGLWCAVRILRVLGFALLTANLRAASRGLPRDCFGSLAMTRPWGGHGAPRTRGHWEERGFATKPSRGRPRRPVSSRGGAPTRRSRGRPRRRCQRRDCCITWLATGLLRFPRNDTRTRPWGGHCPPEGGRYNRRALAARVMITYE